MKRSLAIPATLCALLALVLAWQAVSQDSAGKVAPVASAGITEAPRTGPNHRKSGFTDPPGELGPLTVESDDPYRKDVCQRIESAARERLETLAAELELTRSQKLAVFSILVRSQPDFDPSMMMVAGGRGEAVANANEAIGEALDSRRLQAFEEFLIDDAAWWEDAISQMEAQMAASDSPGSQADEPFPAGKTDNNKPNTTP